MTFQARLIQDGPLAGVDNMARDEAIARAVWAGERLPTLRLYAWRPACVSLGRRQAFRTVDEATCLTDGVEVVRRPTGGLAVLHTDELTYSLSLPASHPVAEGGVTESYRVVARAIVRALQRLGVPGAGADSLAASTEAGASVCFEAPSDYEVVGGGRKLVGSAQWRVVQGMMQHGSVPLCGDIARLCRYVQPAPAPDKVREHAGTLAGVLGRPVSWEEAAEAWREAFAEILGMEFTLAHLSLAEEREAGLLRTRRYADDRWTRDAIHRPHAAESNGEWAVR